MTISKRATRRSLQALPLTGAEEVRLVQTLETARKAAEQLREEYQRARLEARAWLGARPHAWHRQRRIARTHETSIRRKDEIEGVLRVPSLAVIPQAVRSLKTIVVTSASPDEGKTTIAANLAITFAQQGMRVLLVDCDLRKARVHKLLGTSQSPGFTDLLLGQSVISGAVRPTFVENFFALASGTLPPNPSELLGGERARAALETLSTSFDLVILYTPPLIAASDAAVLGTMVDGVLMVVRAGRTERDTALHVLQQLDRVGARVVGAVLNDPNDKVARRGALLL